MCCILGYQVIRVILIFAVQIATWKMNYLILSIQNNWFAFLHLEVLRYSLSDRNLNIFFVSDLDTIL